MNSDADRAIAVVGVGAVLPDAPDAPTYWQNIRNKRYSIYDVPPDRWSLEDYYDPDPSAPYKTYSKIGGWVQGFVLPDKVERGKEVSAVSTFTLSRRDLFALLFGIVGFVWGFFDFRVRPA